MLDVSLRDKVGSWIDIRHRQFKFRSKRLSRYYPDTIYERLDKREKVWLMAS